MALLIHIFIALSSIAFTTSLIFSPSLMKFRLSYGLVFLTVLSGSFLLVLTPSYMVHVCMAGLVYTVVVLTGIIFARRQFARQHA